MSHAAVQIESRIVVLRFLTCLLVRAMQVLRLRLVQSQYKQLEVLSCAARFAS